MSALGIIGAGGFVGTRLLESLVLDRHTDIRPIIRSFRSMASLSRFGSAVDVRFADAERVGVLAEALGGVTIAVNITTGPPAGIVRSTGAIHEACIQAGVRKLIHMSSAVVYGDVPQPISDDQPPLDKHWMPYARAKAASEVWLREHLADSRLETIVLRPGIVWGVRSPHTSDAARGLSSKQAFLVAGGTGIFNGIYIDNLVSCVRTVCDHGKPAAGFYNVGDNETVTWFEFYAALAPALGCDPTRLADVSGERFPHSIGSTIDTIQSLPFVNELYHKLKVHIPDGAKAAIRARLEGSYSYDRSPETYATDPSVSREIWHLQRVRHKLPTTKFTQTFGTTMPVSFADGIAKTLAWLSSLGWTQPRHAG